MNRLIDQQLLEAFEQGDLLAVKELLLAGANPNITDEYNQTPLY